MGRPSRDGVRLAPGERTLFEALLRQEGVELGPKITRKTAESQTCLSFSQQRLWFLQQLEPGSWAYNIPVVLRLRGTLQEDALRRAISEIVRRHEGLRTSFPDVEGRPVQQVHAAEAVPVAREDLQELPEGARERAIGERIQEEVRKPFALGSGPLLRVVLLRSGAEEHVLLLTMHHIVSDGWSMGVFTRELGELYEAYGSGREARLEGLPIQYGDYAVWQREWMKGEELEEQLGYWKKQLADLPGGMELPWVGPRAAVLSGAGGQHDFELSGEVLEGLRALGRREGATLFMVLLGAFQVLLQRYSGENDIVVGTPIAGRSQAETEGLIGFFVNTLVLRTDMSGNPSFQELLGRVREVALGAYSHQELPFEKLVEELHPERDLHRNPLFQVMFAFENLRAEEWKLLGLHVRTEEVRTETAKFDLTLTVQEMESALRFELEYSADLFEPATIARMAKHLERLLAGVVENPETRIGELELLTREERQQIAVEWNRTEAEYPREKCVQELFEEQAARAPGAVAVVEGERQITYGELNRRANQLAHYLRKMGVRPEVLVGLCVERSLEMVVGILGILKAGGAYVPLDPNHPRERLEYMLQDSKVKLLLRQQSLHELPPNVAVPCLNFESIAQELDSEPATLPRAETRAENLIYVMYTSGSTGRPKGVAVCHRSVARLLFGIDYVRLGPQQTVLQLAPLGFDASTFEIWSALLHGGRLVLCPERMPTTDSLGRLLAREQVTCVWLTASLFNLVVDDNPGILAGVQQLVTGGEALSASHVDRALRLLPDTEIVNGYGPTESTTFACCYRIDREHWNSESVPIGRPIGNTKVFVLDRSGQLAPIGVTGELYIGGDGLAQGYVNRPELTAERFVPNAFVGQVPGSRLYRTGDLVRWRPDGLIEYRGRTDDQIKIRGYRIEPSEVEIALSRSSGVERAVVVSRVSNHSGIQLVAYWVRTMGMDLASRDLQAHLRKSLPGYMVPSAYVEMKELPRTLNGKIDRKALPTLEEVRREQGSAEARLPTAVEEILAGIWEEVLRLPQVGLEENFFELGGHSLLATQVAARIRRAFGIEVSVSLLFQHPRLEELAQSIESERKKGKSQKTVRPLRRREGKEAAPLSFSQQRLWFLQQLEPGSWAYNIPVVLRLRGTLQEDALRRAISEIVRRHEGLRTSFPDVEGRPVQQVHAAEAVPVAREDLQELPEGARERAIGERIQEEVRKPFALGSGPLLRVVLLRSGAEEHVLLLTMHHIVSDGWSMGVFTRELGELYEAYGSGREARLEGLPIQYGDYAVWQREWMKGEELEEQLGYWKKQLADLPGGMELPWVGPRAAVLSGAGGQHDFELSGEVLEGLRALGRREGATLFMVLLGAFQVLLQRYSGENDIVVGTPIAGRSQAETEGLIGFFVNTLVLRTDMSGNPSFQELLGRVREVALGAYSHQELPFEKLVEELHPERDLHRNPLFQVMFILQNTPRAEWTLSGMSLMQQPVEMGTAKFDLSLSMMESEQGLRGKLEYKKELLDAGTIGRMVDHFKVLLQEAVARPETRIGELELLTREERQRITVEWNQTEAEYPREKCIQELFEEQAARTPDAVAVVQGERQITYGELERSSNRVANWLVGLSAERGSLVGILAKDAMEVITGVLGVLKAGCVFMPLDPEFPLKRLEAMVAQARPQWCLAESQFVGKLREASRGGEEVRVLCLDGEEMAQAEERRPERESDPDGPCSIYFTSGSTGRPKAILGRLKGIDHFVRWEIQALGVGVGTRVSQLTSCCFDGFLKDAFVPLCAGGTVCVPEDRRVVLEPRRLQEWIEKEEVEVLHCVPSVLRALLNEELEAGDFQRLKWVVLAGEALLPADVRRWSEVFGGRIKLVNLYGATETTVTKLYHFVEPADGKGRSVPIGKPMRGATVMVLDPLGRPCATGVAGEIYIRTPYRALGYYADPERTREAFVENPLTHDPDDIVYRTGDYGRVRKDGNLEFLGRKDQQVKVRGVRVELGEIENLLRGHAEVKDVAVVDRDDGSGNKYLCAYVVLGGGVKKGELRGYAASQLPDYMVPSAYVEMKELPRTLNGKIDRKALPTLEEVRREQGSAEARLPTAVEEILAGIWEEVLRLPQVGLEENFFELGGHSLLATQVAARIRRAFGIEVSVSLLFQHPRLEELAQSIESERKKGKSQKTVRPLRRREGKEAAPLSFSQQRLWFLQQLEPGSWAYNIPVVLRLRGTLQEDALRRAISEIVRRHEGLRTSFPDVEGRPVQQVHAAEAVPVAREDLQELPEGARERAIGERIQEEVRKPFALGSGPLLRVVLLRSGAEEHVLLLTMHHIVSDGWSMGVFTRELGELYEAYGSGREARLEGLPIQYGDYAVWQREWMKGEELEEQLGYWKKQLADLPGGMELPWVGPRAAVLSGAGGQHDFELSGEVLEGLRALGRREGATLFMVLLGAFQVLLQRYSGENDIVVGTPIAGRSQAETEGLIGFFVNTLVLRTDMSGNPSFQELLGRVREVALGAYSHQELPFEKLVEELHPERDLHRNPLFQVMFILQNTPRAEWTLSGMSLMQQPVEMGTAKFDLSLSMMESEQGLRGKLEYKKELLDAGTIGRMVDHFKVLLQEAVARPETRIGELELLTREERQRITVEWNQTEAEYPREKCIQELFEEQAARTPDAVAVVQGERQITYGELNRRANRWAEYLRTVGVAREDRVGIYLNRNFDLIVGLFATFKAGGAYVPLDPTYPAERIAYMLRDSGSAIILTDGALRSKLPPLSARVVRMDVEPDRLGDCTFADPRTGVQPENLAYVIYTSGSTGRPKGVAVAHCGLVNLATAQRRFGTRSHDRVLQFASQSFDASLFETLMALTSGASLTLLPQGSVPLGTELAFFLENELVTMATLPPSVLATLPNAELPNLRVLIVAGEPCSKQLMAQWAPGRRFWNLYGPTESTIWATAFEARRGGDVPTIGTAIENLQAYVLDENMAAVPVGVAGQLCVAGVGLARGYWARPDLTAERFVPNPFSGSAGGRMYRTGDRVKWLPNGDLAFLGRLDQQVKLRGLRIELGEIEQAIRRSAKVKQAVVALRKDGVGCEQIVAYVVTREGATCEGRELREFLKQLLPTYMLPSAFVNLPEIPLTPSGKLDWQALPAPELDRGREQEYVAPRTPEEKLLARVWVSVLGVERIGVHDNFFELGGDSILCIQIVARAREAGLEITARQVFEQQTVAGLAEKSEIARAEFESTNHSSNEAAMLTPIQRWFFEQYGESGQFNASLTQAVLLRTTERLEEEFVSAALKGLMEHHDALRLRFRKQGTTWKQRATQQQVEEIFQKFNLAGMEEGKQREFLQTTIENLRASLDVELGPVFRIALFDFGGRRGQRLLLVVHHLVMDGFSLRILFQDVQRAYEQLKRGEKLHLGRKTASFTSWAESLQQHASSEAVRGEFGYWESQLGTKSDRIPLDYHKTGNAPASYKKVTASLDPAETLALLQKVPKVYHAHIDDVLATALAQAFRDWSGAQALLVDWEAHGREQIFGGMDLSKTVGWFTTMFPVRLDLSGGRGPAEALTLIKQQLRGVPNRGIGYGLLRWSSTEEIAERLRGFPQPEISFNYLGQFDQMLGGESLFRAADDLPVDSIGLRRHRVHLLEINAEVRNGQLSSVWTYDAHLHKSRSIEQLAEGFLRGLRGFISHCQSMTKVKYVPSDFPLVRLNQEHLDILGAKRGRIQDIYPLTPMQQGMILHSLKEPGSGVYLEQLDGVLDGELRTTDFERAWQCVVDRHETLRSSFAWEGLPEPLRIAEDRVGVKLTVNDLRGRAQADQETQVLEFLKRDRELGFDLSLAPLLRLTLFRLNQTVWRFVWSFHHALLDGWSVPTVIKEVFDFYENVRDGGEPRLESLGSYRDYVLWQKAQDPIEAERFWRRTLKGFVGPVGMLPGAAHLSVDANSIFQTQIEGFEMSGNATTGLRRLAQAQQVTLNTVFLGVWSILLARYSGSCDVVFGTTVSGRPSRVPGIENMVGMFINTLPMRVLVRSEMNLFPWLRSIQELALERQPYESSSLAKVQRWAELHGDATLFETLFVFENYPVDLPSSEQISGTLKLRILRAREQTHYPLTVIVSPGEKLRIRFQYDGRCFDALTIRRLLRHFETLLAGVVENPETRIGELELLTREERQQIAVEWNRTEAEYPREKCVQELFEEQAARAPGAVAVVEGERQITYGELNRRANQLAHYLRKMGVRPEVLVGLCVERSLEMVVGILGILKAGGAYVPLDPNHPRERLEYMLRDSRVSVLVTEERWRRRIDGSRAHIVCLGSDWERVAEENEANPSRWSIAENLAYAIYTSGSSGIPKAVGIQHRSLTNLVHWHQRSYGVTAKDRATQIAALTFDASAWELWPYLSSGSSVYLFDDETRRNPVKLLDALCKNEIDVCFLPTPLAHEVLNQTWPSAPKIRALLTGGDQLQCKHRVKLPFGLINHYGPTEAAVVATSYSVKMETEEKTTPPIGKPISNCRVYVLDKDFRLAPIGVAGELYLAGDGLARGYLDRPGLTAESFVPDPFGSLPGSRLYRTGDFVKWETGGDLSFVGRRDQQVKIRGHRIELAEIEAVLREHSKLKEAVVLLREDGKRDKHLVAYLAARKSISVTEIRKYMRARVPGYMIPAIFLCLRELPFNSNGKIDRRALPVPGTERPMLETSFVAPRNELEQRVAEIWQNVLQVEVVGSHDNFFDLGGDSLMLLQVYDFLRPLHGSAITLMDLFRYPNIKTLAAHLAHEIDEGHSLHLSRERARIRQAAVRRRRVVDKLRGVDDERSR